MSIFDAAAELGSLPSGVILGLMLGAVSLLISLERRIKRPEWMVFIGDMLTVLFFGTCLFMTGVGIEGHLRYPLACGTALGLGAVRATAAILHRQHKARRTA